jgi:hypothetical protein
MGNWRFGASSPATRVNSGGGIRKRIPTSFTTRIAICSSRVTPTLLLLSATLAWRAGCAERCKSGSGRSGRKIVRLLPVSHSTADGPRVRLSARGHGLGEPAGARLARIDQNGRQRLLARQCLRRATLEVDQVRGDLFACLQRRQPCTSRHREVPLVLQSAASTFRTRRRVPGNNVLCQPRTEKRSMTMTRVTYLAARSRTSQATHARPRG